MPKAPGMGLGFSSSATALTSLGRHGQGRGRSGRADRLVASHTGAVPKSRCPCRMGEGLIFLPHSLQSVRAVSVPTVSVPNGRSPHIPTAQFR